MECLILSATYAFVVFIFYFYQTYLHAYDLTREASNILLYTGAVMIMHARTADHTLFGVTINRAEQ